MSEPITFTVHGQAKPAGSKRLARGRIIDANPKARPWKNLVAQVAGMAMAGRPLMDGPLDACFLFVVARPKGHFGKSGLNAKGRAATFPASKPDVLKLARGVEDALTGVVYRDDAQIVRETLLKVYGESSFVVVSVQPAMATFNPPLWEQFVGAIEEVPA